MAEATETLDSLEPSGETPASLARKAEGGLSLQFSFDIPKLPSIARVSSWTHQQMINGGLIVAVVALLGWIVYQEKFASEPVTAPAEAELAVAAQLRPNVATEFNADVDTPVVGSGSYVDKLASVIGAVTLGKNVFVAPFASIRGDEGQPLVIGDGSNVQDGAVLHALETAKAGEPIDKNLVTVNGKKYAVFVGKGVSMAHQSQVHGPAAVMDHVFVGMQALVFKATIGKNVVIEPGAKVIGVNVPEGRYIPAGMVVATQAQADALPEITAAYPFATLNDGVLQVNAAFAEGYLAVASGEPAASGGEGQDNAAPAAGGH